MLVGNKIDRVSPQFDFYTLLTLTSLWAVGIVIETCTYCAEVYKTKPMLVNLSGSPLYTAVNRHLARS